MKTGRTTNRSRSNKNLEAQKTAAGQTAKVALENYKQLVGKEIMKPDGNRAYLPLHYWLAPIWASSTRGKQRRSKIMWMDKHGNKFTVRGVDELSANPDMHVLLAVAALLQDHLIAQASLSKNNPEQYLHLEMPISKLYKATGYTRKDKKTC